MYKLGVMRTYCRTPILSFGDGDCTHELFNPDPIFTSRRFSSKIWSKFKSSDDEITLIIGIPRFSYDPPGLECWLAILF